MLDHGLQKYKLVPLQMYDGLMRHVLYHHLMGGLRMCKD